MSYLVIKNLFKSFSSTQVLKDVNLQIEEGELFTILGPSGSGKSTIINCITGITNPDEGEIFLNNENITHKRLNDKNIGLVFQDYSLFSNLSVRNNIDFALQAKIRKNVFDLLRWKLSKKEQFRFEDSIKEILEKVNLTKHANKYPNQLSGGEKQRVSLARALIQNPLLLCLDEPLGALDKNLKNELQKEIKLIQKSFNKTFLYITHDQTEAFSISDRIAIINEGKILQIGTPQDVYQNPSSKFVAEFLGDSNIFEIENTTYDNNKIGFITKTNTKFISSNVEQLKIPKFPFYLSFRPEKVKISNRKIENSIPAIISEIIYLDGKIKIYARLESDDLICIVRHDLDENFSINTKINISFNSKDLIILKK